ncbi:MAG: nucleotidyltransferase family protein [Armatimonadota bacterium]|nr:nucleotidyltransferase family protein [Armatimonadota bacterium]
MHFEGKSAVQETLRRVTTRLGELGIDYAVVGGMALFAHGLRRFTEDVDILVTREGLRQVHQILEGSGYRPPFLGSKNLRDTETGVRIEFLITGDFPGDGRPKPVQFPEPQTVTTELDDIKYLSLPVLLELKLASGMTNRDRLKDLVDAQELIRLFHLPETYTENLNPYVHGKYGELWQIVSGSEKRYIQIWQGPPLSPAVASLADAIAQLPAEAGRLQAMQADGVTLDSNASRPTEGRLVFMTTDPAVAERHGLHDATEFWDDSPTL